MGRKLARPPRSFYRIERLRRSPRLRLGPLRAATAAARAKLETKRPTSRVSSKVRLARAALYQVLS
jgi:hypothetical protein